MVVIQGLILFLVYVGNQAALTNLDAHNVEELDNFVRTKLVKMVLDRLNDTIDAQHSQFVSCETKINQTTDKCLACQSHLPPPQQTIQASGATDPLSIALPYLLMPGMESGKLLTLMAKTIVTGPAVKFLGKGVTSIVSSLASVSENAGNLLLGGAKSALSASLGAVSHELTDLTKTLGKTLEGAVGSLGHLAVGTLGHGLESVGSELVSGAKGVVDKLTHGVGSVANQLAHGATDVANQIAHGAKDVVNGIAHTGKDVVHHIGSAISHVFGKRSSACPNCDKVNSKSSETIVKNVCGSGFTSQQKAAISEINHMTEIYNWAFQNRVIQKVEYDPSSLAMENGQVTFKTVYITYNLNGHTKRIRSEYPLLLTGIPKMGENVGMSLYEGYV